MRIQFFMLLLFGLLLGAQEGLAQAFSLKATGESENINISYQVRGNIPPGVSVSSSGVSIDQAAAGSGLTLRLTGEAGDSWTFTPPGTSNYSISKTQVSAAFLTQKLTFSPAIAQEETSWSRSLIINVLRDGKSYRAQLPVRFQAPEVTPEPEPSPPPVATTQRPTPVQAPAAPAKSDCCDSPSPNKSCCPGYVAPEDNEPLEEIITAETIQQPEISPVDSLADNRIEPKEINILKLASDNPIPTALGVLGLLAILWLALRKKNTTEAPVLEEKSTSTPEVKTPEPSVNEPEEFEGISFEETEILDELNLPPLLELAQHSEYISLDLTQHWEDTAVTKFWAHRDCISDLDDTIRLPINRQKSKESAEDVPEIGGFLLGRFESINDAQYVVSLEKFLPITPAAQNRYTVQFGDMAWMELEEAFKEFPGLKLVGWFHTHPGHGLFLSAADLREHKALFQSRHQVAMEIDPLTAELDLAVFTWTKQGDLNNQEQRKTDSWFSFIDDLDKPSRKSMETPS